MAANPQDERGHDEGDAHLSPLILSLDRELALRVEIAAAQAHLSTTDYIERILRAVVPELVSIAPQRWQPIRPEAVEMLRQTRASVSQGRLVSDSTPIIRQMREEHDAPRDTK